MELNTQNPHKMMSISPVWVFLSKPVEKKSLFGNVEKQKFVTSFEGERATPKQPGAKRRKQDFKPSEGRAPLNLAFPCQTDATKPPMDAVRWRGSHIHSPNI